ncbi:MAG: hypothetical protein KatS3mg105_4998 [Gemmatales bacterium]|nr:MAG: hypothetical protein KatS3mg105_4998 [Gemmatales bacterium]
MTRNAVVGTLTWIRWKHSNAAFAQPKSCNSLVRTMKAMAAVNIRHLERAVESLADYRRTVEMGLQVVLRQRDRSAVTVAHRTAADLGRDRVRLRPGHVRSVE